jgi:hypothetical protein
MRTAITMKMTASMVLTLDGVYQPIARGEQVG